MFSRSKYGEEGLIFQNKIVLLDFKKSVILYAWTRLYIIIETKISPFHVEQFSSSKLK